MSNLPAAGISSGMDSDRSEFAELFKQVRCFISFESQEFDLIGRVQGILGFTNDIFKSTSKKI